MIYKVKCSHCGHQKEYKPKKKLTKLSHTTCPNCKKNFYIKVNKKEEIINLIPEKNNDSKVNNNGKITKSILEPIIAYHLHKNPTPQMLKIAVDFCKISDSEEQVGEIDMSKLLEVIKDSECG